MLNYNNIIKKKTGNKKGEYNKYIEKKWIS